MHYIHRYILDKIIHAKQLRNRDLRPPRVESNLFQYHLKQLIKSGYIQKTPEGLYELALGGVFWADRYSGNLKEMRPQSKVVTLLCLRDNNKVFLLTKHRQPFIGTLHFPAGKIHLGESWDDAASREFAEKIGIAVPPLTRHSIAHVSISNDAVLLQDYIAIIYTATLLEPLETRFQGRWVDEGEVSAAELMPGVAELMNHIFQSNESVAEISVSLAT